jgi:tRNA nucleotidyltransferase (CCA-adding enzyme)
MRFKQFYLTENYSKETTEKILSKIKENGGKLYIVGGAVRDELMGIKPKDIDFLVTGITLSNLSDILSEIGKVNEVGKSFGIIKAVIDGEEYDFAIPRKETSTGPGHKDQLTKTDHTLSVEDDISRRDFGFNAIAKDVETGKYIDPYHGISDIKHKIIRAVGDPDKRFEEDPLRILRAIQFAVRFNFDIEEKTKKSILKNVESLEHLPAERFLEEFKKAIEKSKDSNNMKFLNLLLETGIGKLLFGEEFDPIEIHSKNFVVNMIAMFINGGNYKKLKLPNEEVAIIELAKKLNSDVKDPWIVVKNKDHVKIVEEFMKLTKNKNLKLVEKILEKPMSLKELDITGEDLLSAGVKNIEIGKVVKNILEQIWNDKLKNKKDDILKFVG